MRKELLFVLLLVGGMTFLLFFPFFRNGAIPMPASFMVAWYEPWKSDTAAGGVPTIPHKAVGDDIFRQIYPMKMLATDIIKSGALPLWNTYSGGGQPLLANLHPGYLNPFSLLLLAGARGWAWFVIAQLPLLFLAVWWYGKRIGLSGLGALTAASIYSVSGGIVSRFMYGDYVYAMITLPVILAAVEDLRKGEGRVARLVLPAATAFLLVSVQPQIAIYVMCMACCYAAVRLMGKRVLSGALFIAIGIGLAAVQLLPTMELIRYGNVTAQSSSFIFTKFLMPLQHLVTFAIPNYFGNPGTYNFWGKTDFIETAAYVGMLPLFFVLVSLMSHIAKDKWRTHVRFFVGVIVITVLLTLDWAGTRWLYGLPIPVLATNIPTRLYIVTGFCIAILAGIGVDRSRESWVTDARKITILLGSMAVVGITLLALTFGLSRVHAFCSAPAGIDCWKVAYRNTAIELGAFLIFGLLFITTKGKSAWIIIVFIISMGAYNARKIIPFSPPSHVMPEHAMLKAAEALFPGRIVSLGSAALATDLATQYRFGDPNYYDPLYIRRYGELISYGNTGSVVDGLTRSDVGLAQDVRITSPEQKARRQRAWDILGVKGIIFPEGDVPPQIVPYGKTIYRDADRSLVSYANSVPHAYMVYDYEVHADRELLTRLFDPSFDPQGSVLLEKNPGLTPFTGKPPPSITVVSESTNGDTSVAVETPRDGILVVTDNEYPGWHADIDGTAAEILRANYAFRAVRVPAGRHVVSFVYAPESLKWGAMVSMGSCLLWLGTLLWYNVTYASGDGTEKRLGRKRTRAIRGTITKSDE